MSRGPFLSPLFLEEDFMTNIVVKERPEDFEVKEECSLIPSGEGDFAFYLLKKRNSTTWDVIGDIARRIRRSLKDIGYGGLKDRRGITYQYISILNGPKKNIKGKNYHLKYLGQCPTPMNRRWVKGNRFSLVVQAKSYRGSEESLQDRAKELEEYGVVNYFDEQRFVSSKKGEFAAREIILKHYRQALYLLLCNSSHYEWDKGRDFRRCVERQWKEKDLSPCASCAPSPWEKKIVTFLSLGKFSNRSLKKALSMVNREYMFMICNAYQSYIWNKVAARFVSSLTPCWELEYKLGKFFFYQNPSQDLLHLFRQCYIPLPGPRSYVDERIKEIYLKVLKEEGINSMEQFRCRVLGAVFRSTRRGLLCFPQELSIEKVQDNTYKVCFFLSPGSYATLIVKVLFNYHHIV